MLRSAAFATQFKQTPFMRTILPAARAPIGAPARDGFCLTAAAGLRPNGSDAAWSGGTDGLGVADGVPFITNLGSARMDLSADRKFAPYQHHQSHPDRPTTLARSAPPIERLRG